MTKAWLRRQDYVSQRLAGAPSGLLGEESPAEAHQRLLREFRMRKAALAPRGTRGRGAGLGPAAPPGPNWVPLGPFAVRHGQGAGLPVVAGRVPDLVVSDDGQRVYLATSNGGIWRSTDAGRTWLPMSDEFDLDPVTRNVDTLAHGAIAMADGGGVTGDVLYVGTGEGHTLTPGSPSYFGVGMLRSDDGGANWVQEASSPGLTGRSVFAMAIAPGIPGDPSKPDQVLTATSIGIYRRTVGATPWQREILSAALGAQVMVSSVVVGRRGGSPIFFATTAAGQVFSSMAAGVWNLLPTLPSPAVGRTTLACSASDPPVLYALASRNAGNSLHGVHRLDDGAAAWRTVGGVPAGLLGDQGWYDQAITVDPTDPNFVYVGGSTELISGEWSGAVYRCVVRTVGANYAATSTQIGGSVHADIHALVFRPGSSRELWVGCDGGVFASHDARLSGNHVFEARNTGLANLSLMGLGHHPHEEAYAFCGAQDCGGLRYDGHEAWDHQLPGDGGDSVIDWNVPTRLLSIYLGTAIRRAAVDGARYADTGVSVTLAAGETNIAYPPMVGTPPSATASDANLVAIGAERPYVSTTFGGGWVRLSARGAMGGPRVRSMKFASAALLWVGWEDGHVARYDLAGGTWTRTDQAPPGEGRPVTGIAIDISDATGGSIYVTLGGATGAGPRLRRFAAGAWSVPAGAVPSAGVAGRLLDSQHNAVVVDPAHPSHVYVAADIGVWRSTSGGTTFEPFSSNLPDAAVLDLDVLPTQRLLRATTHGRGVFEVPLDGDQKGIELVLRANALDQRRRPARAGAALPTQPAVQTRLDGSPDIFIEPPDTNGRYRLPGNPAPTFTELLELPANEPILATLPPLPGAPQPGTAAITRVHVVVRNRGVTRADDVRVSLLVGPEGHDLPASYADFARGGVFTAEDGWREAGTTTAHGLRAGHPAIVTFAFSSDLLPPAGEAVGKNFLILAVLHHADDPFSVGSPAATQAPLTLVTTSRHAALKRVAVASGVGRAAPPGGTGLVVPISTAILGHRRLASLVTGLQAKIDTAAATVQPVERRVLAMAKAGMAGLEAGPKPDIDPTLEGHAIGSYALLGSLGFEIPRYTSAFLPGGTWVAETLRSGTGDPHMSRIAVPSTEVPLQLAQLGQAAPADVRDSLRAFATGMLAGAAAGIVLSPQLADLYAQDTNADWAPLSSSRGARALEHHLRKLYLSGTMGALSPWLPPASGVPTVLWDNFTKAIEQSLGLPGTRVHGFGSFEAEFDSGFWLNPDRLNRGYGLMRDDIRVERWGFWPWFGVVSPIMVMPSIAFAFARLLPHSRAFVDGGDVDERAVFEALAVSMGLGSLAPFLYSMLLWSKVDEHTEAFTTALVMGLVRLGLVTTALATSTDESQDAGVRWAGLFPPLAATDVYAGFRAVFDPHRHPGNAKVFGLQTIPALTGLTTLGLCGLARLITGDSTTDRDQDQDNITFWLITALTGAVAVAAASLPAMALSEGGGWQSWFLRDRRPLPVLSAMHHAGVEPLAPLAAARVYDQSQLWSLPGGAADTDLLAYPAGMRPLVKFWWDGDGDQSVKYGESTLTFRHGGNDQVVDLPASATATSIAAKLQADVAGLKAEVIGRDEPEATVPRPKALADLGDGVLHEAAEALRTGFVRVPTSKGHALVVRQAPRVEHSTTLGRAADSVAPYVLVPATAVADDLGSGLRDAADMAALLITAAAPSFGPVAVNDARTALPDPAVQEVMQVFRRWNLDERRVDEWRSLITGHGSTVAPTDPVRDGQNMLVRRQATGYVPQTTGRVLAEAMGWLPLWRAWLRIAENPAANVGGTATAGNPNVTFPDGTTRRPRNRELTEGVRFLFDMGAT